MARPSLRSTHTLVPHWFTRQAIPIYDLTGCAVCVFLVLCDRADPDGNTWCPQRRIADESGFARSNVQIALIRLEEVGILEVTVPGTPRRATRYRIPTQCPLPAKVIPMPTRKARMPGASWEGYDGEVMDLL
jgi:hypothetical protein